MHCNQCGKQISGDSNFCNQCGAPQKAGLTAATTETRWEVGQVRCKMIKYGGGFSLEDSLCVFELEAIDPNGAYIAEVSQEFRYYLSQNPIKFGLYASPYLPQVRQEENIRERLNQFVVQIMRSGWEPAPVPPASWFQLHFRRRTQ